MIFRSKNVYTVGELQQWIDEYRQFTVYPCNVLKRFAIGFYQIHSAMDWNKTDFKDYESIAAAAIHFEFVAADLKTNLAFEYPDSEKFKDWITIPIDWRKLTYHLSAAQAMVVYSSHPPSIKRKSRYKPEKLRKHLGAACQILISSIPANKRTQAFREAMDIMTGSL